MTTPRRQPDGIGPEQNHHAERCRQAFTDPLGAVTDQPKVRVCSSVTILSSSGVGPASTIIFIAWASDSPASGSS